MSAPLRIGLVCPYSLTIPGGVQAQVLGLARVLRRMGHEARVLGPCDGPPPATFVTPLGNSVPTAANGSIAPLAPDPSASLRTMRALRDEDFDVLHLHEPLAPGPTMTALLVDAAPVVATFHAAGDSASYRYGNRPLRWLDSHIEARCVVSKDALELVRRYFGDADYEVLFNGVELDRYQGAVPTKTDGPTIFFCGRHEPRKGLAVLLDALQQLPPDVRCWVASDGPATAELRALHAGDARIEWLGRISEEEKMSRLAGASVFCAPSIMGESFGVVLIEAMAAGTPIVSTDLPGYLNVATPGRDAVMVPPDDPAALADALRRVLADDELAHELRGNGLRRAEDFSMETLAQHYVRIYERLAAMPATAWQGAHEGAGRSATGRSLRRMLSATAVGHRYR
jgi:phosphatidyl-myo-inositol alpha-mannosyltransferase